MLSFIFTPIGRYIAAGLAVLAIVAAYTAWQRNDAVEDAEADRAEQTRQAVERRNETREQIRTETDDALIDRLVGPR